MADWRHPEDGITILEVLLATMLLGVTAIIVFSAFGIGLRAATLAGAMNTATTLAQDGLAAAGDSPCGHPSRLFNARRLDEGLGRYRREVSVHSWNDAGPWELTATVTWKRGGRSHSVTLKTLRYISAACRELKP